MNKIDKASKDSKILVESCKDTFEKNLLAAVKTNSLVLDSQQISSILYLAKLSLDEGYNRALPNFQNTIKKYVDEK